MTRSYAILSSLNVTCANVYDRPSSVQSLPRVLTRGSRALNAGKTAARVCLFTAGFAMDPRKRISAIRFRRFFLGRSGTFHTSAYIMTVTD